MNQQTMIHTHQLTKHFTTRRKDTVEAVRGLDLTVEPGEMVAFLGPNGAGKSTTLRMLTTLVAPTSGHATVAGADIAREPGVVRQRIGYIGQGNGAGHQQRGRDELVSQGRTYGLNRREARTRAGELVDSLDLAAVADRKVSTLSGGQRRRLDIAMGLIHAPDLLFLDEPSTGLDPQNRANLQEHIVALRERTGTTVVLTTHYLDEADALAERIVVIDHGTIVADDTPDRLKAGLGGDLIGLGFASEAAATTAASAIDHLDPRATVVRSGSRVEVRVTDGPRALPPILAGLGAAGVPAASADLSRSTLDDVFLNLTGRSLREEGGGAPDATDEHRPASDSARESDSNSDDRQEVAA